MSKNVEARKSVESTAHRTHEGRRNVNPVFLAAWAEFILEVRATTGKVGHAQAAAITPNFGAPARVLVQLVLVHAACLSQEFQGHHGCRRSVGVRHETTFGLL